MGFSDGQIAHLTTFKLIQIPKVGGVFRKFKIFATTWALRFSKLKKK